MWKGGRCVCASGHVGVRITLHSTPHGRGEEGEVCSNHTRFLTIHQQNLGAKNGKLNKTFSMNPSLNSNILYKSTSDI